MSRYFCSRIPAKVPQRLHSSAKMNACTAITTTFGFNPTVLRTPSLTVPSIFWGLPDLSGLLFVEHYCSTKPAFANNNCHFWQHFQWPFTLPLTAALIAIERDGVGLQVVSFKHFLSCSTSSAHCFNTLALAYASLSGDRGSKSISLTNLKHCFHWFAGT